MAIIINGDGIVRHEAYGGWEWLKKTIGADVLEVVHLMDGLDMWIDEEGKLKDHTVNTDASLLYRASRGGDYIAGKAVLLSHDEDGNEVDIPKERVRGISVLLALARIKYLSGGLGPRFVASGPHIEIRSLTDDELAEMFGGRE